MQVLPWGGNKQAVSPQYSLSHSEATCEFLFFAMGSKRGGFILFSDS